MIALVFTDHDGIFIDYHLRRRLHSLVPESFLIILRLNIYVLHFLAGLFFLAYLLRLDQRPLRLRYWLWKHRLTMLLFLQDGFIIQLSKNLLRLKNLLNSPLYRRHEVVIRPAHNQLLEVFQGRNAAWMSLWFLFERHVLLKILVEFAQVVTYDDDFAVLVIAYQSPLA